MLVPAPRCVVEAKCVDVSRGGEGVCGWGEEGEAVARVLEW